MIPVPSYTQPGTQDPSAELTEEIMACRSGYLRPYAESIREHKEHGILFEKCFGRVKSHLDGSAPEPVFANELQKLKIDLKHILQKHKKPTAQPAPFLLGKLDERLKDFIIRAARRHAGLKVKLPDITLSPPAGDRPLAVETTVPVMYRSSTDQKTNVRMHVLQLELERFPSTRSTLDIPSTFEGPKVPETSPAREDFDEDAQNHAFRILAWISAHTMDRVFEPGSLESYVDYLKGLACLGSRIDQDVPGHGGIYGGMDLFTIAVADAGYVLSPSTVAISHISSGSLPKICVPAKRDALLRAIERLETVYLTTSKIESAWKECARRSDFETDCIWEDEPLPQSRCTCTFAERLNTVHLCNRCNRSLLCGDNATEHESYAEIICASCADEQQQESGQRPKCHRCHMGTLRCKKADGAAECDQCIKAKTRCKPIELTDSGDLPETRDEKAKAKKAETAAQPPETKEERWQRRRRDKQQQSPKCHHCFMDGTSCRYSKDPEKCDRCTKWKKSCIPLRMTDTGDLPEPYHVQRRHREQPSGPTGSREQRPPRKQRQQPRTPRVITRLEQNWRNGMNRDINIALEGTNKDARGLLGHAHLSEYWREIENRWSSENGWPDALQGIDRAFDQLGRPLLQSDQVEDIIDLEALKNAGPKARGPFGMEFDALSPVYPFNGSMVNHAPDNVVPTSSFLNSARHYYAPLLLPMVASLCRKPGHEEMERISQKVDHIYLIALQFPSDNKKRLELFSDVQRTSTINRQHTAGIAEPEACLMIDGAWGFGKNSRRGRYHLVKPHPKASTPVMDAVRVEAFIVEIEEHFGEKLPRADGDTGAVYLFHRTNKPVQWDLDSVRCFYSERLSIMTRHCNKHYDTECTVESLFAPVSYTHLTLPTKRIV